MAHLVHTLTIPTCTFWQALETYSPTNSEISEISPFVQSFRTLEIEECRDFTFCTALSIATETDHVAYLSRHYPFPSLQRPSMTPTSAVTHNGASPTATSVAQPPIPLHSQHLSKPRKPNSHLNISVNLEK